MGTQSFKRTKILYYFEVFVIIIIFCSDWSADLSSRPRLALALHMTLDKYLALSGSLFAIYNKELDWMSDFQKKIIHMEAQYAHGST